jgi:hypothetical protein
MRSFSGIFIVLSRWRARTPTKIAGCLLLPAAIGAPDDIKPLVELRLMLYLRAQVLGGAYWAEEIANLVAFRELLGNQFKEPLLQASHNVDLRLAERKGFEPSVPF